MEIRMIKDIGDFFIHLMMLDISQTKGVFLKNVENLTIHATALIEGLASLENLQSNYNYDNIKRLIKFFVMKK